MLFCIAIIVMLGFIIYANSLTGKFLWDDEYSVVKNEYLKSWQYLPQLFTHNFHVFADRQSLFYRPMTSLTLLLDYRIWQLNPWGYHLTNIIFHVLTALAVYFLLMRITMDSKVAFISGLLFVALPVHTEAVAYISGRADPIAAFLALISFLFYIGFLENKKGSALKGFASFFFLVAAIWSKEIAAVTPFLFFLYEISFRKHKNIKSITSMQRYRYFFLRH